METHNDNNEKRRRKKIQRYPVLVRSVKPGQTSIPAWQRENAAGHSLLKINSPAA